MTIENLVNEYGECEINREMLTLLLNEALGGSIDALSELLEYVSEDAFERGRDYGNH